MWLSKRSFYLSIDGQNSIVFDLLPGTAQGSILGPVLYAIFVSPLFDLNDLTACSDDTFIPICNKNLPVLKLKNNLRQSPKGLNSQVFKEQW
jgi:hypothetical protein